MKFRVQAQRKFAQGAYIPPTNHNTMSARFNFRFMSHKEDVDVYNGMNVNYLLDMVSFYSMHPHFQPIVVLERLPAHKDDSDIIYESSDEESGAVNVPEVSGRSRTRAGNSMNLRSNTSGVTRKSFKRSKITYRGKRNVQQERTSGVSVPTRTPARGVDTITMTSEDERPLTFFQSRRSAAQAKKTSPTSTKRPRKSSPKKPQSIGNEKESTSNEAGSLPSAAMSKRRRLSSTHKATTSKLPESHSTSETPKRRGRPTVPKGTPAISSDSQSAADTPKRRGRSTVRKGTQKISSDPHSPCNTPKRRGRSTVRKGTLSKLPDTQTAPETPKRRGRSTVRAGIPKLPDPRSTSETPKRRGRSTVRKGIPKLPNTRSTSQTPNRRGRSAVRKETLKSVADTRSGGAPKRRHRSTVRKGPAAKRSSQSNTRKSCMRSYTSSSNYAELYADEADEMMTAAPTRFDDRPPAKRKYTRRARSHSIHPDAIANYVEMEADETDVVMTPFPIPIFDELPRRSPTPRRNTVRPTRSRSVHQGPGAKRATRSTTRKPARQRPASQSDSNYSDERLPRSMESSPPRNFRPRTRSQSLHLRKITNNEDELPPRSPTPRRNTVRPVRSRSLHQGERTRPSAKLTTKPRRGKSCYSLHQDMEDNEYRPLVLVNVPPKRNPLRRTRSQSIHRRIDNDEFDGSEGDEAEMTARSSPSLDSMEDYESDIMILDPNYRPEPSYSPTLDPTLPYYGTQPSTSSDLLDFRDPSWRQAYHYDALVSTSTDHLATPSPSGTQPHDDGDCTIEDPVKTEPEEYGPRGPTSTDDWPISGSSNAEPQQYGSWASTSTVPQSISSRMKTEPQEALRRGYSVYSPADDPPAGWESGYPNAKQQQLRQGNSVYSPADDSPADESPAESDISDSPNAEQQLGNASFCTGGWRITGPTPAQLHRMYEKSRALGSPVSPSPQEDARAEGRRRIASPDWAICPSPAQLQPNHQESNEHEPRVAPSPVGSEQGSNECAGSPNFLLVYDDSSDHEPPVAPSLQEEDVEIDVTGDTNHRGQPVAPSPVQSNPRTSEYPDPIIVSCWSLAKDHNTNDHEARVASSPVQNPAKDHNTNDHEARVASSPVQNPGIDAHLQNHEKENNPQPDSSTNNDVPPTAPTVNPSVKCPSMRYVTIRDIVEAPEEDEKHRCLTCKGCGFVKKVKIISMLIAMSPRLIEENDAERAARHAKRDARLAGDDTTSTDSDASSADRDTIHPESDATPAEGDASPAECDATPAEGDARPAESDVEPAEGDARPAESDVEPAEGDARPAENDVEPAEGDDRPTEGDINPGPLPGRNSRLNDNDVVQVFYLNLLPSYRPHVVQVTAINITDETQRMIRARLIVRSEADTSQDLSLVEHEGLLDQLLQTLLLAVQTVDIDPNHLLPIRSTNQKDSFSASTSTIGGKVIVAPTYYMTKEDFDDPIVFYDKIKDDLRKYGIVKAVPPSEPNQFKPEYILNEVVKFRTVNHYINKMFNRWGPASREMSAIKAYLTTQNVPFVNPPLVEGMELNLTRLYHVVQSHGGLKEVLEKKKWSRVAEDMRIAKRSVQSYLNRQYFKYLLPFDALTNSERNTIKTSVERCWTRKHRRMLDTALNPLHRQKRLLAASDSSEEESDDPPNFALALQHAEDCVVNGRYMTLGTFKRISNRALQILNPKLSFTTAQIEEAYWRLVLFANDHVCVHTASIDSAATGFGFTKNESDPMSKHPWNLKTVSSNKRNVLRSLGAATGVTVPTVHLGMIYSTSCWHRDPHGLPWLEYLHDGPHKIWYAIANDQSKNFRNALKILSPALCQNKNIWLSSDIAMIPPSLLGQHNVTLSRMEQKAGEFIFVDPKAYSCSISTGYSVSESVYFATEEWLDNVYETFQELRQSCEPAAFALEQLLIGMAHDQHVPVHLLSKVHSMLSNILQVELDYRTQLLTRNIKTCPLSLKQTKTMNTWNGQDECDICRAPLFLSKVVGLPEEDTAVCVQHANSLLDTSRYDTEGVQLVRNVPRGFVEDALAALQRRMLK